MILSLRFESNLFIAKNSLNCSVILLPLKICLHWVSRRALTIREAKLIRQNNSISFYDEVM
jgi:hypothetical protein